MKGFLSEERPIRTLREVLQRLRESYCGNIGYEVLLSERSLHEKLLSCGQSIAIV
jgi:2-oxoglutarate dehydrogenase complex dehydrogenase (E1) component-like enzyme